MAEVRSGGGMSRTEVFAEVVEMVWVSGWRNVKWMEECEVDGGMSSSAAVLERDELCGDAAVVW